jgi:hypothetical protein
MCSDSIFIPFDLARFFSFKKDMMETEGLLLICFYLHQVLDEIRPYLAGTGGGEC